MQAITDLIMYFHKGGLVMWPLLACSITVIAIAIERFIYYKSVDSGAVFASRYCAAVRSGDFAVATELARKGSGQCAHSYFAHRMDNMITDMEQCFSALLEAETRRARS